MNRRDLFLMGLLTTLMTLPAFARLQITDIDHYDTTDQMLLANEINESGEPYAEAMSQTGMPGPTI